jgi:hypothetical protein
MENDTSCGGGWLVGRFGLVWFGWLVWLVGLVGWFGLVWFGLVWLVGRSVGWLQIKTKRNAGAQPSPTFPV